MPEDANQGSNTPANQAQPGQVIAPGGSTQPAQPQIQSPAPASSQPAVQPVTPPAPQQQPAAVTALPEPIQSQQPPASPPAPLSEDDFSPPQSQENPGSVAWTASEYIAHEKSKNWYAGLVIAVSLIAAALFLITRDITAVCLVIVGGIALGFYGSRDPRQINYEINNSELIVGTKRFSFSEFKSFSVTTEGAFPSIVLLPHKRFAQLLTIYYPPEHENQIAEVLAAHLPFEEHTPDIIERLAKQIQF